MRGLTVSQVRHRVSLVSIPSKRLCTRVACEVGRPLLLPLPLPLFVVVLGAVGGVAEDAREPTLLDTVNRGDGTCQRDHCGRALSSDTFYGWCIDLAKLTVILRVLGGSRRGTNGIFAVFLLEFLDDFI